MVCPQTLCWPNEVNLQCKKLNSMLKWSSSSIYVSFLLTDNQDSEFIHPCRRVWGARSCFIHSEDSSDITGAFRTARTGTSQYLTESRFVPVRSVFVCWLAIVGKVQYSRWEGTKVSERKKSGKNWLVCNVNIWIFFYSGYDGKVIYIYLCLLSVSGDATHGNKIQLPCSIPVQSIEYPPGRYWDSRVSEPPYAEEGLEVKY